MPHALLVASDLGAVFVGSGVAAGAAHVRQISLVGSALDYACHEGAHP